MLKQLAKYSPLKKEGLAVLLFTSGSSGTPKIAGLSHQALMRNALGAIKALDLRKEDCWHLSLPLYHVSGIATVFRCLLATAKVGFDGRKSNLLSLVPTQLLRMMKNNDPMLQGKKAILVGGAPIPDSLLKEAYERKLPIVTTWGMTETSSMMTFNGKILDGREVKLGADGEIFVRGAILFEGYLQEDGSLYRPMTEDGWFATGDLGWQDEQKKLHIKGRKDRMFIAYGENIQPEEIERELLRIPGILQALVVPSKDPEAGALPVAYIEAEGDFTPEVWKASLKEQLPSFKVPKQFLKLEMGSGLKAPLPPSP